jgi:hypothetical protein
MTPPFDLIVADATDGKEPNARSGADGPKNKHRVKGMSSNL